ncbi:MAG: transcription antitermination factor NusB [Rhodovibrionaceae bacterium]|nr:transcription antitermination factor NusB [Rhodovibrionaceae bacterium]
MAVKAPKKSAAAEPDRRTAARLLALQALYQVAVTGAQPQSVLIEFLEHRLDEELEEGTRLGRVDRNLFRELVEQGSERAEALDRLLSEELKADWPLDRLEMLMRLILRLGAYELAERPSVSAGGVIAEYVELTRDFYGGGEPGVVHRVLDRLAQRLRGGQEPQVPGGGESDGG